MVAATTRRLLLFGSTGAIGQAVGARAREEGWTVTPVSRGDAGPGAVRFDPVADPASVLDGLPPFDAVCWAHGANLADSIHSFDRAAHLALYEANCLSVLLSAAALIERGLLQESGARLVVVSSIWQERARPDKLSYCVTKAAIGGAVRSLAVDLGPAGHLVNAVLPGVLDTPMTAANLTADQIAQVRDRTPAARLPDLASLVDTVLFLCSTRNTSISGQSITVDLGMSNAILL